MKKDPKKNPKKEKDYDEDEWEEDEEEDDEEEDEDDDEEDDEEEEDEEEEEEEEEYDEYPRKRRKEPDREKERPKQKGRRRDWEEEEWEEEDYDEEDEEDDGRGKKKIILVALVIAAAVAGAGMFFYNRLPSEDTGTPAATVTPLPEDGASVTPEGGTPEEENPEGGIPEETPAETPEATPEATPSPSPIPTATPKPLPTDLPTPVPTSTPEPEPTEIVIEEVDDPSSTEELSTEGPAEGQEAKVVYIGDSRFRSMYDAVAGGDGKWECSATGEYTWLLDTAIPEADPVIGDGTKVLINIGLNDLGNYESYASVINSNASRWKERGADVYFVSVGPVASSSSILNTDICNFNTYMYNNLEIPFIDLYNYFVTTTGFDTTDGQTYTSTSCMNMYSFINSMAGI